MKYLGSRFSLLVSTIAAGAARADDDRCVLEERRVPRRGRLVRRHRSSSTRSTTRSPGDAHVSNTWGVNAPRWATASTSSWPAEVEYEWLNHFGDARERRRRSAAAELQTITANLKAIAPYGHWQPYVLAGFGVTLAQVDQAVGLAARLHPHELLAPASGSGSDYYFTENVALNLGSEFVVNTAKISNNINGDGSSRGFDYFSAQGGLRLQVLASRARRGGLRARRAPCRSPPRRASRAARSSPPSQPPSAVPPSMARLAAKRIAPETRPSTWGGVIRWRRLRWWTSYST